MNMNEVKVSIVVAVYNTEKYLDRCLASLTGQTLKDIEIICVNDASTDNSLKKLYEWKEKDHRIKVIDCPENMKQGHARNVGIESAVGKYIGIVDSDDFVDVTMYQSLIECSHNMTDDLVVSNSFYRFKEGQVVGTRCFLPGCKSIVDIKRQTCAYGGTMWTNIVRKDFFIENNLFYPEKLIYEDNANGPLIYLKANSISVIEHPFYYYCLNPSSTVQKKNHPNYFDRTVTSQIFYKNAQSDNQYKYYKEEIDFNFYRVFLYNTVRGSISTFSSLPSQRLKDVITTYKREWGG